MVNGATGAYGSAAVLVALAMGAARVVAAGRNQEALDSLAKAGGSRVTPAVLTGNFMYPHTAYMPLLAFRNGKKPGVRRRHREGSSRSGRAAALVLG